MMLWQNPVLGREFKLKLRNKALFSRIVWGWSAMAAAIVFLWPESGVFSMEDQQSRVIFKVFALGQLGLSVLLAPSITAPLITDEKEQQRFGMLFASLLSPLDILMGKWLSSLALLLLVMTSGLPFLLLNLVLGGVSWNEVLQVYLISLMSIFQFGMLGLFLSCLKSKTYDALLQSYAWLLVIGALTWLPSYLLGGFESLVTVWALLRSLSPFSAMMDVVAPEVLIFLGRLPEDWRLGELWSADVMAYLILAFISSMGMFIICLRTVFVLPLGKDGKGKASEKDEKKKKFPYILINPDKRARPFGVNSLILFKELRCKMFGHLGNLIRGIYIGVAVSASLVILVSLNVETLSLEAVRMVAVLFQMLVIMLLTPALTSSAVSEELSSGTLEMLRMTPVTAWQFWVGKVLAGNLYLLILLASSSPIYAMIALLEVVMGRDWMMVFWIIGLQVLMLIVTSTLGVWCSAILKNTQKAVGMAYAILFSIVLLPFGAYFGIDHLMLKSWLSSISPFLVCINQSTTSTFQGVEVYSKHFIVMGAFSLLMLLHSLVMVRRMMRQAR